MTTRSIYLAKSRHTLSQRAHFAVCIPKPSENGRDLAQNFKLSPSQVTAIHVTGEPLMGGYALEFKRNYDCSTSNDLQEMIFLGSVDQASVYDSPEGEFFRESQPRGTLEREAARVPPPPRGQNVREPIDGVSAF